MPADGDGRSQGLLIKAQHSSSGSTLCATTLSAVFYLKAREDARVGRGGRGLHHTTGEPLCLVGCELPDQVSSAPAISAASLLYLGAAEPAQDALGLVEALCVVNDRKNLLTGGDGRDK